MARKQTACAVLAVTHCTEMARKQGVWVVFTVTHCTQRTCEETACVLCLQAARRWAGWRCKATRRRRLISTVRPLSLLKSAVTTQRSVVFAQSFSVKHMHRQVTRSVSGYIMWPWDGMPKEAWTCFCSQLELKSRVKSEVVPSSHKEISVFLWPISSVVKGKPTWPCPEEPQFEAERCFCGTNIDKTTVRSLQMEVFAHFLCFRTNLHLCLWSTFMRIATAYPAYAPWREAGDV